MKGTQATVENQTCLNPRHEIASLFGIAGVIVCATTGSTLFFLCCLAGWGDGSTGSAISDPGITAFYYTAPFLIYFTLGVVGSLSRRRPVRLVAAAIAHVILAIYVIKVLDFLQFSWNVVLVAYLLTMIVFLPGWIGILRQKPDINKATS